MKPAIGILLLALGAAASFSAGIFDLLCANVTPLLFLVGLIVAGAGLTIWQGPSWMDY